MSIHEDDGWMNGWLTMCFKSIKTKIIGNVMKHGQMKRNTMYLNSVRTYDGISEHVSSVILSLYSVGLSLNIIVSLYNIDIIWDNQSNIISMTWASWSMNVQHFKGMTNELSCLDILCVFLDWYLCNIMYYTSIIHLDIIFYWLYSSQRWSLSPPFWYVRHIWP